MGIVAPTRYRGGAGHEAGAVLAAVLERGRS